MDRTKIAFSLADVLEIENLLAAYHIHIASHIEEDEYFERMRLAQECRLDHILKKLDGKLSFMKKLDGVLEGVLVDD